MKALGDDDDLPPLEEVEGTVDETAKMQEVDYTLSGIVSPENSDSNQFDCAQTWDWCMLSAKYRRKFDAGGRADTNAQKKW